MSRRSTTTAIMASQLQLLLMAVIFYIANVSWSSNGFTYSSSSSQQPLCSSNVYGINKRNHHHQWKPLMITSRNKNVVTPLTTTVSLRTQRSSWNRVVALQFPYSILQLSSSSSVDNSMKDDGKDDDKADNKLSWITTPFSSSSVVGNNNNNNNNHVVTSLTSALILVLLDVTFRNVFRQYAISFPSSLAGCGAVLATLLVAPPSIASTLYNTLAPGAKLLAKWLSVFFVPSLITLPLLSSQGGPAGSTIELFKVGLVVVGGFYFSLMSTAWSVVAVRNLVDKKKKKTTTNNTNNIIHASNEIEGTTKQQQQQQQPTLQTNSFSDQLRNRLFIASLIGATATILLSSSQLPILSYVEPYCSTFFFLCTTLYTFVLGSRFPKKVTKWLHPLVTCTGLTWGASYGLAKLTRQSWKMILSSYRRGGGGRSAISALIHPGIGAGDILLFLLGPAVVSLACQMYERRRLVQENVAAVATGVGVGSAGGLFATALAVRLLQIGNPYLRLSLLSRNITSPLAIAMASMIGANVSLAVAFVVVTGLLGANFGPAILDAHGIVNDDDIARGLAMGAASHGLGTAAMVNEPTAFPFSAISMALTASVCTILVSIPVVQRLLLQLSLGW